jgi:hypothetical protein
LIEITDALMGDTYDDREKNKNYERGYYLGYYEVCGCICSGQIASGNVRTNMKRMKKINGNLSKYERKIGSLKTKLKKEKKNYKIDKLLRDIDYNQNMVMLIMSSCNRFL